MRSKPLATLIVSTLSLIQSTTGGSIRRKRRYVVFQGEPSDGMDRIHNLPSQNPPPRSNRKAPASSYDEKGHGRQLGKGRKTTRSRHGDYLSSVRGESESESESETDYPEGYGEGTTGGRDVETLDWDYMTTEELEYYFEIQKAQSFTENPAPMAQPVSIPAAPSKPLPLPLPTSTAREPSSYPKPNASTSQPVFKPTTESPTITPVIISTPPPSPTPTPLSATPQPTVTEASAPVLPTPVLEPECEILTRRDALLTVVEDITEQSVLMDASTPQAQAFLWLLEDDLAQIDPCTYPTPKQRYVLSTFYFATVGPSWNASNGWLSADGECIWLGINCDDNGGVTRLELRTSRKQTCKQEKIGVTYLLTTLFVALQIVAGDNNLTGSLPKELIAMDFLLRLDVSGNAIAGSLVELPPSLSFLDVEENAMAGSPFESVLGLSDLKQLRLSSNTFTGTIPTAIGTLEGLEELWIANNQFEGATIPSEIGNLKRLGTLLPSIPCCCDLHHYKPFISLNTNSLFLQKLFSSTMPRLVAAYRQNLAVWV
jgi:hypothetical protein